MFGSVINPPGVQVCVAMREGSTNCLIEVSLHLCFQDSLSLKLVLALCAWPASQHLLKTFRSSLSRVRVTGGQGCTCPDFTQVLRTRTQVFMCVKRVFYSLSHLGTLCTLCEMLKIICHTWLITCRTFPGRTNMAWRFVCGIPLNFFCVVPC